MDTTVRAPAHRFSPIPFAFWRRLLTWRLWRLLDTPPLETHYLIWKPGFTPPRWLVLAVVVLLLPFILEGVAGLLLIPFYSLWVSASVVNRVRLVVKREKDRHALDKLYLTPGGPAGISWLVIRQTLYTRTSGAIPWPMGRVVQRARWLSVTAWLLLGLYALWFDQFELPRNGLPHRLPLLTIVSVMLCLFVYILIDYRFGLVTGALIAALAGVLFDYDRFGGGALVALWELIVIFAGILMFFIWLPELYAALGITGALADALRMPLVLVMVFAVKEGFNRLLWRVLVWNCGASESDLLAMLAMGAAVVPTDR